MRDQIQVKEQALLSVGVHCLRINNLHSKKLKKFSRSIWCADSESEPKTADLTRTSRVARLEKLPCGAALRGEKQEHPILENSTACTMSNAKNPAIQPFWLGFGFLWKTFKQQSKSVMICSVSFKLAVLSPIPVGCRK